MFAEIDAGIADHDSPEEDKESEERGVDGVFGAGRACGALVADGRLMAAEAEEGSEGEDVGGVGRGEAVLSATLSLEHADIVESVAGARTGEDILENVGNAVGAKKAKGYADKNKPPAFGLIAERGDAEKEYQHDGPAPMLAKRPEKPVEERTVVLVDPIKNIGF